MRRGTLGEGEGSHSRRQPTYDKNRPIATDKHRRSANQRERAVFEFFLAYTVEHMGHTPTTKEVMVACELPSTSVVQNYLRSLVKQNKLRYLDGLLVIPGSVYTWLEQYDPKRAPGAEISALHRAVDYQPNGGAGFSDSGGDRPLVPGSTTPRRLVQRA